MNRRGRPHPPGRPGGRHGWIDADRWSASATSIFDQLTAGIAPTATKVWLTMPEVVEDGGAVPVAVTVDSPMTDSDHVRAIHVVAAANPEPTVAVFHLTPASGRAAITTRIRLAESQIVVAMAEMSDGSWYAGRATTRSPSALQQRCLELSRRRAVGDPRVKLPETVRAGEVFEIKTLLAHPMQTGRQTDSRERPAPPDHRPPQLQLGGDRTLRRRPRDRRRRQPLLLVRWPIGSDGGPRLPLERGHRRASRPSVRSPSLPDRRGTSGRRGCLQHRRAGGEALEPCCKLRSPVRHAIVGKRKSR